MKFDVDAEQLRKSLAELVSVVRPETKGDKEPVVEMELQGGKLTLRVSSIHDAYYSERILSVTPGVDGKALAKIQQFTKLLSVQDGSVTITMELGENGYLYQGATKLCIQGSAGVIPYIQAPTTGWQFNDNAATVLAAVARANRYRDSNENPRYAIAGIGLLSENDRLEVVGSNGTTMSIVRTDMPFKINGVIACRPELANILSTYEKTRSIEFCPVENGLWVRQTERLDFISVLDAEFPDYRQYIDKKPETCGQLEAHLTTKLRSVLSKGIIEGDQRGLVTIYANGSSLYIEGALVNNIQEIRGASVTFPKIILEADHLASILGMFNDTIDVSLSRKEQHLYLRQGDTNALMFVDEVKNV